MKFIIESFASTESHSAVFSKQTFKNSRNYPLLLSQDLQAEGFFYIFA